MGQSRINDPFKKALFIFELSHGAFTLPFQHILNLLIKS